MSDDLVAFLTARLAEDVAAARAAGGFLDSGGPSELARDLQAFQFRGTPLAGASIAHIARHGPKRALREVAAVRRILDRYADCLARMEDHDYPAGTARDQAREYEDFVLPNLIAAYSGHPDYRAEWKP